MPHRIVVLAPAYLRINCSLVFRHYLIFRFCFCCSTSLGISTRKSRLDTHWHLDRLDSNLFHLQLLAEDNFYGFCSASTRNDDLLWHFIAPFCFFVYFLRAIRNFALLARGLITNSFGVATSGLFVKISNLLSRPCSASSLKYLFTSLSSRL